jgi:hypothetical protein
MSWSILTSGPMSEAPKVSYRRGVTCLGKEARHAKAARFRQAMPLVERLSQQTQQLRKEAKALSPGGEREELVRRLGS